MGDNFSCALSNAGLKCWGLAKGYDGGSSGGNEQDGLTKLPLVPVTTSSDPIVSVHAMYAGTCAVLRSSAVKCWGDGGDDPVRGAVVGQPALAAAVGDIGDAPNEMSQLGPIDDGTSSPIRSFDSGY